MTPDPMDEVEAFLGLISYEVWVECEEALTKYVKQGVNEPDQARLSPLLGLKYQNAIPEAVAALGSVEEIRDASTGSQRFLYESVV